jgi:hypothetical protein
VVCIADGFEANTAFLPAQRIQTGHLCSLPHIITKHRDVNVLGIVEIKPKTLASEVPP